MSIVLIGQGIQIKPILKAKKEYLALVDKLEKGEVIEIDSLPKATLGNILIVEFGNGLYYKYPNLKIKN